MEMHDKVPQTQHFRHVGHCLEAFRQDIICNADDTPRYTGISKIPTKGPTSGLGQVKMCRDWQQLQTWAREHSACYKYDPTSSDVHHVDLSRFKYCPDGRRPWEHQ